MTDALLGAFATIIVAGLGYLGIKTQSRTAKAGSDAQKHTSESEQALEAWKELVAPTLSEVARLRERVGVLEENDAEKDRRIDGLGRELHRWQSVARTLARWGITMRDQLRALGHEAPSEPDELIALRIVSDTRGDDLTSDDAPGG